MTGLLFPAYASGKMSNGHAADYARRKGWTMEEAERWLAPVLDY